MKASHEDTIAKTCNENQFKRIKMKIFHIVDKDELKKLVPAAMNR